ncbi:MAG: hypothetical protein LKF53_00595, partial [Solobacterium sp.]|nr:hypothetical protein [Solobacterium sp.]MCH4226498.1 hypothetical protein [Solobacterium sp.]MCH4283062.1 hypothetical protein [Solobacterium sp.]
PSILYHACMYYARKKGKRDHKILGIIGALLHIYYIKSRLFSQATLSTSWRAENLLFSFD